MNTLHKSLTITLLAISIFISGLKADFVAAQNTDSATAAHGRSADLVMSPYLKFRRLTTEDGLSSNQTWELAQDKHGFMWFGTADGLVRTVDSVNSILKQPSSPVISMIQTITKR